MIRAGRFMCWRITDCMRSRGGTQRGRQWLFRRECAVHAGVHGDIALWLWLLAQPSVARGFVADSIKREPQLTRLSDASFFAIGGADPAAHEYWWYGLTVEHKRGWYRQLPPRSSAGSSGLLSVGS